MREPATLRLGTGEEVRVLVERDDLKADEILVRRADEINGAVSPDLVGVVDEHLTAAVRHDAGTTDRLLAADRRRPY